MLEQTAGELAPDQALAVAREMVRDRRVLTLEGGRMTTLAVRAQEQAIERRAAQLAQPASRDVGAIAREHAAREVAERIGGPLSPEQHHALEVLTGPERAAVLVGPAGTGKGVVIDAAARAEQYAGRETIGVAVPAPPPSASAQTAPPCRADDHPRPLVARANTGTIHVGRDTTVILDEAGMVDHKRLDALTELVERSGAKLIAVGDGKQLPSIGPGGMFDRLAGHAPTAELTEIHRTKDPAEQRAWQALRAGEPERAMAHYASRGPLHFSDTRDQAAEHAVQTWATLTEDRDIREVALIADASNQEIDRLNARANTSAPNTANSATTRSRSPASTTAYAKATSSPSPHSTVRRAAARRERHPRPGQRHPRAGRDHHTRRITPSDPARRRGPGSLRLAYAQHVYRQQGATVERSVVLTGGWQTSKETAYVEATRARQGTDWYIAREDLGRRARRRSDHEPRPEDVQQSRPDPVSRAPRAAGPRVGREHSESRSRPAAAAGYQESPAPSSASPLPSGTPERTR